MAKIREAAHPYRWVVMVVIFFTYAIVYIPRLCVPALAPFIRDDLLLTSAQIGTLMSAHAIGTWLLQMPSGVVVDRVGPRWVLFVGLLLAFGSMLLAAQASSYLLFVIFLFGAGWGSGCLSTATVKMVMHWFPAEERATVMGTKQAAFNLGGVLAAATLPTLALTLGWRFGIRAVAFLALFAALLGLVLYKEPKLKIASASPATAVPTLTRKAAMKIFTHPEILKVSFAGLLLLIAEFAVITHTTLFMKDILLFSAVTAGMFLAWTEGAGAVGKVAAGIISDRVFGGSRKRPFLLLAIISLVCCAVAAFLVPGVPSWLVLIVWAILGASIIGWSGLTLALISEFSGTELAGIATGYHASILLFGSILGPPFFGYIVDVTQSYKTAWLFLVICLVVACVFIIFVKEERRVT